MVSRRCYLEIYTETEEFENSYLLIPVVKCSSEIITHIDEKIRTSTKGCLTTIILFGFSGHGA